MQNYFEKYMDGISARLLFTMPEGFHHLQQSLQAWARLVA